MLTYIVKVESKVTADGSHLALKRKLVLSLVIVFYMLYERRKKKHFAMFYLAGTCYLFQLFFKLLLTEFIGVSVSVSTSFKLITTVLFFFVSALPLSRIW